MGGTGLLVGWFVAVLWVGPTLAQDADRVVKTTGRAELRAGANQNYKVTETLESGTLLVVTEERLGGWLEIEVPGGFECYVHSDYVQVGNDAQGEVLGDNVNLRAVATSKNNYPITRVQRGTRLRIIDRESDWLKVLSPPGARAWIEEAQVAEAGTRAGLAASLQKAAADRDRRWRESSPLARKAAAEREAATGRADALAQLQAAVSAALANPEGVDFSGWRQEAVALRDGASVGPVRESAVQVLADIQAFESSRERLEQEARQQRELKRERDDLERMIQEKRNEIESIEEEEPEKPERSSRFDAIGWVEAVPKGLVGPTPIYPFQLVRGGQTQYFLQSKSGHGQKGKFRLEDYRGRLVGIRGRIRNTGGITYRVFHIEHLEVLAND